MLRALCFHKLRLVLPRNNQHRPPHGWALVARRLTHLCDVKVGQPRGAVRAVTRFYKDLTSLLHALFIFQHQTSATG
jgi:hypothetical protein